SCFGDSGGPIYLTTPRGTFAIGVVSRGLPGEQEPCGDGGIYVRTDKIAAWLASVTGANIAHDPCDPDPLSDDDNGGGGGGCDAVGGARTGALVGIAVYLTLRRRVRRPAGSRTAVRPSDS